VAEETRSLLDHGDLVQTSHTMSLWSPPIGQVSFFLFQGRSSFFFATTHQYKALFGRSSTYLCDRFVVKEVFFQKKSINRKEEASIKGDRVCNNPNSANFCSSLQVGKLLW
jgi:hypothetical protein